MILVPSSLPGYSFLKKMLIVPIKSFTYFFCHPPFDIPDVSPAAGFAGEQTFQRTVRAGTG